MNRKLFAECDRCPAESPVYPVTELCDRWLVAHYRDAHPEGLDALCEEIMRGEFNADGPLRESRRE
jgi:hypothetical protein